MVRVWAPRAETVEVVAGGRRHPMERSDDGWWSAEVAGDYAFVIDGQEPPLPDPRSPWQPRGVHGPSRPVDHAAYRWSDGGFVAPSLAEAVLYELHVGTFSPEGTFDGAAARLDHLVELGVTHVELMPVADFPGRHGWGYDGVALFAPKDGYGGPDGLKRLVDACHARGLAVVLDVVYNHLGPSGNYLARFGPYFNDKHPTHWGPAVNLDGPDSDEVRRFFADNAAHWLRDYHVDGLRLDAVHALADDSALHFLEQLAVEVEALGTELGRRLVLVAESDRNDPRLVLAREGGGYGLDAVWSDDFHHALHAVLTGETGGYYRDFGRVSQLAKAIEDVYVYDGQRSAFRRRRHGRPVGDLDRRRFLAYAQNHDQIGNRARGDRLAASVPAPGLQIAAALTLLSPCVPMLFQGEEWGASTPFAFFTDHDEEHLQEAIREGRRREFSAFGWRPEEIPDPQDPRTFEASRLDWSEPARPGHRELLAWHGELIRLRRRLDEMPGTDRARARADDTQRWLVMERGPVTVVASFADGPVAVPLAPDRPADILMASTPPERRGDRLIVQPGAVVLGPGGGSAVLDVRTPSGG